MKITESNELDMSCPPFSFGPLSMTMKVITALVVSSAIAVIVVKTAWINLPTLFVVFIVLALFSFFSIGLARMNPGETVESFDATSVIMDVNRQITEWEIGTDGLPRKFGRDDLDAPSYSLAVSLLAAAKGREHDQSLGPEITGRIHRAGEIVEKVNHTREKHGCRCGDKCLHDSDKVCMRGTRGVRSIGQA